MKKSLVLCALAASGLFAVYAQAQERDQDQDQEIQGRVISSTPVLQQVALPQQYCSDAPVVMQSPNSGAGAVMGALAGGAMGNAVGDGGGRALATVIGLVGGAMVGNNIEGTRSEVQNVQRCSTQTSYENRILYYDVVYEYAGKRYQVRMPTDPGQYLRLQVTPVGAMPAQAQPAYAPQYPQQYPPAPVYIQPAPRYAPQVYVQPPAPLVVYQTPYVRPYFAPIGLSLNFGYGSGYGNRHRHWRH